MKKKFSILLAGVLLTASLTGCGGKTTPVSVDSEYKTQMETFFSAMATLDKEINALDPADDNSVSELFIYLEQLEAQYKYLSEIEVPEQFIATESLADEAYDYMVQANNYIKQSFLEDSYNQYTYEAGIECYNRANKRMQYIIDIIHGETPKDDNITVE